MNTNQHTPAERGRTRWALRSLGVLSAVVALTLVGPSNAQDVRRATASQPARTQKPASRASAQLAFLGIQQNTLQPMMGGSELAVYRPALKVQLIWKAVLPAAEWRWQVAMWPFPTDPAIPPAALLREGSVPKGKDSFTLDLGAFPPLGKGVWNATTGGAGGSKVAVSPATQPPAASGSVQGSDRRTTVAARPNPPSRPGATPRMAAASLSRKGNAGVPDVPIDFHVRILPVQAGKVAGPASNTVIAHYRPGPDPYQQQAAAALTAWSEAKKKAEQMQAEALVYKLEVVSFARPIFEDASRWGCVVIVKNPYYAKPAHALAAYAPGKEYCPPKDPKFYEKDFGGKVLQVLDGYAKAWNGLSWFYDKVKSWVATEFAKFLPCEALGKKAQGTCEDIAKQVASTAITVGLAAAGIPPTIPDLEGMGELAKGEAVNAAVDYTCAVIENNGVTCTQDMKNAMSKVYAEALKRLQAELIKQTQEPHCGDAQTAAEHGVKPLPCFSSFPGAEVKPAPGAVETAPKVTVRVTRTKPNPSFPLNCGLSAGVVFKNNIAGFGPAEASLWLPASANMPALAVNGSQTLTLNFGPRQRWSVLGPKGATAEAWQLLSGATGTLYVTSFTHDAMVQGQTGKIALACATGPVKTIQVPVSFGDATFPWLLK